MDVRFTSRVASGPLAAAIAVAGLALAAAPASAAGSAQVYVIHGIKGQNLDVTVDDDTVARSAKPKDIIGPLRLAAGRHTVAVKDGSKTVADSSFSVKAGQSVDVVAHRQADASMGPIFTVFRNNVRGVAPGKLRLVVAHVAAAPPADIKVNGKVLFNNVANGEELALVVPAKTYNVAVVPAATDGDPILGPVDLQTKAGTLTRVFAIGSATQNTMDAVVHVLKVSQNGAARPSLVQTGTGGQAADAFTGGASSTVPVLAAGRAGGLAVGVLALAMLGHLARRATRRRLVR
jgi:hypothetical protein